MQNKIATPQELYGQNNLHGQKGLHTKKSTPMRKVTFTILCTLLLIFGLCSTVLAESGQTVIVSQNPVLLLNLQRGREFALNGRYELAREHLLMALAASQDRRTRTLVAQELDTVELMIKTLR